MSQINDFFDNDDESQNIVTPLNIENLASLISAGGAMDSLTENFEQRDSQIKLLKGICHAFNEDKIAVFEAGTGVGKSFAYLIPAILWSVQNKERIVISTGTINLQQQIFEKDIPFAQKITGKKIKALLVKGRQNYICLRRYFETINEIDLFTEEKEELDNIKEWLKTTKSGDKSDLSFMPTESLWQRINSESDGCRGQLCPHKDKCYVMKVKKEAASSQILVVNHHLLFADIEMRLANGFDSNGVLPPYKKLIFDEAHGIENAATSFFSEGFNRFNLMKQIRLIYRARKGSKAGLIFSLETLSTEPSCVGDLISQIGLLESHLLELDEVTEKLMGKNYSVRVFDNPRYDFTDLFDIFRLIASDLALICKMIGDTLKGISDEDKKVDSVWEATTILRRLEALAAFCSNFIRYDENPDKVFWIDKGKFINYYQTPLDMSTLLHKGIFEAFSTVVCTSATLGIASNFSFWMRRTGILFEDKERILQGIFESPFPYKKNTIFAVPTDAVPADDFNFQSYVEDVLPRLIKASDGRTLVLFTSYESLKSAFEACFSTLSKAGINLYKQGDDDRFRLLEKFKKDTSSVLFGTYSFWEGVDVPGESLSHVIIVKLPFGVPTDPVFSARSDAIGKRGGNSFMELSVPDAVIKFRQGFGRLMRKSTDRGSVTVLDKRLITKRYGSIFINSIPQSNICVETLSTICSKISYLLDTN
ncbi:MAG: helicase C-terminal domain-containing protein [Treponemataceae bacterium]|nr:helicase C-terminal domain-containing protein [Treponemataceae bacterium]